MENKLQNIKYDDGFESSKIPLMGKNLETIFRYNIDINKNAYLNWRTSGMRTSRDQFVVIGEAFFSAAYNLIQQCLLDNKDKKADLWIFPIMFNVVHGMEVYLKAINASLSVVLNKKRGIAEGEHDLKGLCCTAKKLIVEYKKLSQDITSKQMLEGIKVVGKFVDNIYAKTDDMTFARYPLAKNRQGHFYIDTFKNEVIDLVILKEQVLYVFKILDLIYDSLEVDLEIREEEMSERLGGL